MGGGTRDVTACLFTFYHCCFHARFSLHCGYFDYPCCLNILLNIISCICGARILYVTLVTVSATISSSVYVHEMLTRVAPMNHGSGEKSRYPDRPRISRVGVGSEWLNPVGMARMYWEIKSGRMGDDYEIAGGCS